MIKKIIFLYLFISLLLPSLTFGKELIRDAEIEETLKIITEPLIKNTKIDKDSFKILIINDSSMNAFVTSGHNIFIHYGLITKLETVEQLQSVIAHEIAHIIGGHYIKRVSDFDRAQTVAGIGIALSVAASLATEDTNVVIGLAAGAQSASKRAFLKNTRTQEASADQTGIKLMAEANINPNAALEVLKIFKGQEFLTAKRQDPYIQTHPLNSQRISSINKSLNSLNYTIKPRDKNLDYLFQRMRAKFIGFTGNPNSILHTSNFKNNKELTTYTRAIAYHRMPNFKLAKLEIDNLLKMKADDPYYNELKAQFLLENGNVEESVKYYQRALELEPDQFLLKVGYARALNAIGEYKTSISLLKEIYTKDPNNGRLLRELAIAYSNIGETGWASLLTAERYALYGKFENAILHAKRVLGTSSRGSILWLKAEDLVLEIENMVN